MRVCDEELFNRTARLPWWFGAAYREPARRSAIYYPIPLNLLIGAWMQFRYRWDRWRVSAPEWIHYSDVEPCIRADEKRGREIGRHEGYREGWEAAIKSIEEQLAQNVKARR